MEPPAQPARAAADVTVPQDAQATERRKILVAHGEPVVLASMQAALEKEDYDVLVSSDGVDALMKIQREQPLAAVIDVALPKMYGFEICEFLKRNQSLSGIKVVLVAAEHKHARYKRTTENFYGAEDVIEEREIQAVLVDKLQRLLEGPPEDAGTGEEESPAAQLSGHSLSSPEAPRGPARSDESPFGATSGGSPAGETPHPEAAARLGPSEEAEDQHAEAREKARRLARIIVSDIALYNPETVDRGVRAGGLAALIRDDLEEGYKLFRSRIDESVAAGQDFIREALDDFIGRKRRELGISGECEPEPDGPEADQSVADEEPAPGLGIGNDDF